MFSTSIESSTRLGRLSWGASALLHIFTILLILFGPFAHKPSFRLAGVVHADDVEIVPPTKPNPVYLPNFEPNSEPMVYSGSSLYVRPAPLVNPESTGAGALPASPDAPMVLDSSLELQEAGPASFALPAPRALSVPGSLANEVSLPKPEPQPERKHENDEPTAESSIRVGGDVVPAVLIHSVKPVYPQLARLGRVQGNVEIDAVVTENGEIRDMTVVSGHPLLVAASLASVRQWRYQAARLNGVPTECHVSIVVRFELTFK